MMGKEMHAIRIHSYGGTDNMKLEKLPVPKLNVDEVLIKVTYASVNFLDIQMRRGELENQQFYKKATKTKSIFPMTIGSQCLGIIESAGAKVTHVNPGDRVIYGGNGTYATHVIGHEKGIIPVADDIPDEQAAAGLTQGFLAYAFTHKVYPVQQGDWCLIQAAAGGLGSLICQMAKNRGGKGIGVTSKYIKAKSVLESGADEVLISTDENIVERVYDITGGSGVQVVYDGVGKDTFETNLDSLDLAGYLVIYGQSSGYIPPFDLMKLQEKGSLFLTRTNGLPYMKYWPEYVENFRKWIANGRLSIKLGPIYSLDDACKAHDAMENRDTTGRILLKP